MPSLTEGLKIDAQGNVVSTPPVDTALKPGQFNDAPPVKAPTPVSTPMATPAPLLASSTQSRQQFGKDQETLSKFATELEVVRQQALKIQDTTNQLAAKEKAGLSTTGTAPISAPTAKPAVQDSSTQIAEFNKSIGRAANDSTGITLREDGSIDTSGVPDSMKSAEQVNSEVDRDTDDAIAQLDVFQGRFEATTQAMIEDIKRRYEMRREQTKDTNMRYLRGLTTMGIRSGRARYAPEIQSGILASEERAGLARLAELDAEEMSLIAQAQAAQDEKDYKLFHDRTELLAQKRKEKNDEAQRLFQSAVSLEQLSIQRSEEAREAEKYGFEQEESTITSLSFGLIDMLTGDPEADMQAVTEIANIYGIDPNKLYVAAQEKQNAQRQKEIELLTGPAREYQSALSSGAISPDTSFEDYLNTEDPTRPYAAEGAALDVEGKKLGLDKTRLDMDATRLAMEKTRVDIAKGLQDLAETDITSGNLSDKDIKNIDNSPQGKNLLLLQDLQSKTTRYKTLVEQYGTQMVGQGRVLLESAYAELQIAWKEAANLGALQGADLNILSDAVKPATGIKGKIGGIFTGGAKGIESGLTQMEERINTDANRNYDQLLTRNSKYNQSDYVKGLAQPFKRTFTVNGQTFMEGDIIEVDGVQGRVEKDGTVTTL